MTIAYTESRVIILIAVLRLLRAMMPCDAVFQGGSAGIHTDDLTHLGWELRCWVGRLLQQLWRCMVLPPTSQTEVRLREV